MKHPNKKIEEWGKWSAWFEKHMRNIYKKRKNKKTIKVNLADL